jgi:hypothetical protein
MNLSRLAAQWEESVNGALAQIISEAELRLDELIGTIASLIESSNNDAPKLRADLERIGSARLSKNNSVNGELKTKTD